MITVYRKHDADEQALVNRPIAVIGYGSQGHAHALNLRDSGLDVRVGLRPGSANWDVAQAAGLRVLTAADAAAEATLTMLLVPDTDARAVYEHAVRETLTPGKALYFAHGFNVHYGFVTPPDDVDVALVAPKSPGHRVRELYLEGAGVPGLIAVHRDATGNARRDALAYAHAIGCTRAGVLETSFAEETETDLFGEQAVLCGGVTALVQAGFDTLVDAGYQPEMAYFECLHELKLIVDLMYQGGLSYMRHSISDTAEYGDYEAGPQIINEETRRVMRTLLRDIQSGDFARRWVAEQDMGGESFQAARYKARRHRIEEVGRELRSLMPFLNARTVPATPNEFADAASR